jgi:hypothetical protein
VGIVEIRGGKGRDEGGGGRGWGFGLVEVELSGVRKGGSREI